MKMVDDDLPPWDENETPPDDDTDTGEPDWVDDDDRAAYHQALEDDEQEDAAETLRHLARLQGDEPPDPGQDHRAALRLVVGEQRARRLADAGYLDLDAFLNEPEPEYDWLIPGILERRDRVILTGQEGKGKSTLLRQIAVQVAAGIHPFTLEPISPKRVLLIDLENPRRHVRRQLRPLRLSAGTGLLPGFMIPIIWNAGIDLLHKDDRARLADLVALGGADLLIIGPSYKMAGGDPTAEETARAVTHALDELRETHDLAVILEAHQPHATPGARRVERPYGASLWSRWPEFGLHLSDGGQLNHWRGDRDARDWPELLQRGGDWPWTAITDARAVTFARILDETRDAGKKLSQRDLGERLDCHHSQIGRAIKANQAQYDALVAELREGSE